jgi:hypothetical protein
MTAPVKAAGIGHGKADDEAQCTGPSDPVLRRDWYRPCRGRNHGAGNAGRGDPGIHRAPSRERGVHGSASGRRRCRAAGLRARRCRASLSVAAGAYYRWLSSRPVSRHLRTLARPNGCSDRLGQSFVIDNRPGVAGVTIGTEAVVKAPPDGYTLLSVGAAAATSATLYEKLSFDFIRDILFGVPTRGRALVTTVSQGALAARALTRPSGMASSGLAGRDRRATRGLRSP